MTPMKRIAHPLLLLLLLAAALLPLQAGAQCGYVFEERFDIYETLDSDSDWVDMEDAVMLHPETSVSLATAPIPMGFTFRYFGEYFDSVTVTAVAQICFEGYIPGVEWMSIACFLNTLPLMGGGYLLHKTVGSPGSRKFVMEFHSQSCTTLYDLTPPLCWQVHLCEADMSVRFLLYGTVTELSMSVLCRCPEGEEIACLSIPTSEIVQRNPFTVLAIGHWRIVKR